MAGATPEWRRFDARERLVRIGSVVGAALVVIGSWELLDINLQYVTTAPAQVGDLFGRMYPPDVTYLPNAVGPLAETIQITDRHTVGDDEGSGIGQSVDHVREDATLK